MKGNWWIWVIPSVAFIASGIFILFMAFSVPPSVESGFFGIPRRTELIALGVFFIVGPQLFSVILALRMGRNVSQTRRIKETGIAGRARVVSAEETGTYINNAPQLELVLDVELPGMETDRIRMKSCVSVLHLQYVQPGSWIKVWADRENPNNLAFEFTAANTD